MTADVFSRIYATNAWNGVESRSGPGSGAAATRKLAADIVALVDELGVRSVLDAACGDGYWMPDLPGYTGIDVAPEAIAIARRRHPERRYLVGSLAMVRLPRADLVILRDALQHLSLRDGMAALAAVVESGPRWLLASTYVGRTTRTSPPASATRPTSRRRHSPSAVRSASSSTATTTTTTTPTRSGIPGSTSDFGPSDPLTDADRIPSISVDE